MEGWYEPDNKGAGSQLDCDGYYELVCPVEGLDNGEGRQAGREQGRQLKYDFNLFTMHKKQLP